MKGFLVCIFIFLCSLPNFAQDAATFIKEAEHLEALPNEKGAFEKFKLALVHDPGNVYVLTKCSELCSRIGNRETNTDNRDAYYAAAISYSKKALALAPQNDEANVSMAIALGRIALLKSGKEKITAVKDIKHYADFAIKYNRQNFKAWHVLGKWNYEVSNLNAIERAAIKVFYGGLPNASFKKAIEAYDMAKKIKPDFVLNYLELAKAYHKNNQKDMAIANLKALLLLPNKTEDDARIKTEARNLLAKWS
ncbi:MAG: hypothetical protein IPL97_08540 [Niastella sp.]|nr:hypothetical protein [Niastella sp.]